MGASKTRRRGAMKKAIVLGIVLGLILICNRSADAQKKAKVIATQITKEFDVSVAKLPPNFKGDNDRIRAIAESLPKEKIKKSDFETDAEFERRKAIALSGLRSYAFSNIEKPPTEGAKMLAKMYPDLYRREPWIGYDINQSAFWVRLETIDVSERRTVKKGRYVGQNAFGVKKVVDIEDAWDYSARISVGLYLELPVPIEVAKVIKDDLRVLAVVKPAEVWYEERFHGATINAPSDTQWHDYTLVADKPRERHVSSESIPAIDVWIYNYRTGEILYKKSDESKKAAIAAEQAKKKAAIAAEEAKKKFDEGNTNAEPIEEEWKGDLYLAKEYLNQGRVKEAKEKLNAIPVSTNAWRLVGYELMKEVWEKERR
jgi:hypothetical protein